MSFLTLDTGRRDGVDEVFGYSSPSTASCPVSDSTCA
jgi:hypothetical protein